MRKTLWLLMLVPLLAGCLDGGTDDGPEPTPTVGPETPFLERITVIDAGRGQGEPSLGVTPDGVLFTNIGSLIYRSRDGGATWEDLGDPAAPIPNNDPDLAVDVDGTVWESRLYALACNEVSVSRDQGDTWSTFPVVCEGPVGDRQYVVPAEGGTAYLYWHQVPTFYQTVMKTTDYGQTWTPTMPAETPDGHLLLTEGSSWGGGGFYNPTTGSVFLTYTRSPGIAGGAVDGFEAPGFSVTRDGFNWEEGVGPAFNGSRLGLGLVMGAADDAGNIYLAWGEAQGDDIAVYVAGSRDDGATWTGKMRLDDGEGSKVFPAIAAGQDGQVAVAYYEGDEQAYPDDMHGNWTVTLDWTTDFWGDAAWQRGSLANDTVKQGPICISGTTCTGGREFLDYFALERMPDGRVATVYNTLEEGVLRNQFAITTEPLLGPL